MLFCQFIKVIGDTLNTFNRAEILIILKSTNSKISPALKWLSDLSRIVMVLRPCENIGFEALIKGNIVHKVRSIFKCFCNHPLFGKEGVFYIVIPAPCSTSSLTVSVVYNVHALELFAFLLPVQNQLIV